MEEEQVNSISNITSLIIILFIFCSTSLLLVIKVVIFDVPHIYGQDGSADKARL